MQPPAAHSTHRSPSRGITVHDRWNTQRGDLIDGLLNRGIDHVGHIDMALYRQMANAAAGSALIAQRDAELIVSAFGR